MRNVTVVTNYEVYKYNELSDEAKEKVKQWHLEGQEAFIFTDMCEEDLYNLFGENDLKVQYSLGYCQGDGFNIYGKIDAKSIFKCLENHNDGCQLKKIEDYLTEEEKLDILNYSEVCGEIEIPYNNRYCYSLAYRIEILNEWAYYLENYWSGEVNKRALEKFERLLRFMFEELCKCYEKQGYEFFYEISEEDLEEACECNMYEFLEDGTIFNK